MVIDINKSTFVLLLILTFIPNILSLTTYSCMDSNILRTTENSTISINGSSDEVVRVNDLYCYSGCTAYGCEWGENLLFRLMIGVIVLFVVGYFAMSPHVMVVASLLGMLLSSMAIRYGFYMGDYYFYGTFIRIILMTVFITFVGLLIWCIKLGKKENENEEDDSFGRR